MTGVLRVCALIAVVGCTGRGEQGVPQPVPPVVGAGPGKAAPAPKAAWDRIDVVCKRAVRCGLIARSQGGECQKGPAASRLTLVWGSPQLFPPVPEPCFLGKCGERSHRCERDCKRR